MPIINDKGRRLLRQIHWMSAAFSLMALLFYAATGFLLNNDGLIRDGGAKTHIEKPLSESLKTEFTTTGSDQPTLSLKARSELEKTFGLDLRFAKQRNAKGRVTITLPDPGTRTSVEIDAKKNTITLDREQHGPLAFATDLHKGKNVRPQWGLVIDAVAMSIIIFALSGLMLLIFAARARKSTWWWVGAGLLAPIVALIAILHL